MDFDTIKRNYDLGLWSIQLVKIAVKKGLISKAEYNEITGCVYPSTKKVEA